MSHEDADEYNAACRQRFHEESMAQEREKELKELREKRQRREEEDLRKWKEERDQLERALKADGKHNFSVVNHYLQARSGVPFAEAQRSLTRQLRWMGRRIAQLNTMIEDLEQLHREAASRSVLGGERSAEGRNL